MAVSLPIELVRNELAGIGRARPSNRHERRSVPAGESSLINIPACTPGRESTTDGRSGRIPPRPKSEHRAPPFAGSNDVIEIEVERNTLRFLQSEMPQSKVRE